MTRVLVWVVFLLLFSWDLWEATGNMLGMPAYYEALGVGGSTPWLLLGFGMVVPLAAPVVAARVTRRRGVGVLVVTLVLAYATVQALTLSAVAAEQAWRAFVLQ